MYFIYIGNTYGSVARYTAYHRADLERFLFV